jgi:hypothetical protein
MGKAVTILTASSCFNIQRIPMPQSIIPVHRYIKKGGQYT